MVNLDKILKMYITRYEKQDDMLNGFLACLWAELWKSDPDFAAAVRSGSNLKKISG